MNTGAKNAVMFSSNSYWALTKMAITRAPDAVITIPAE